MSVDADLFITNLNLSSLRKMRGLLCVKDFWIMINKKWDVAACAILNYFDLMQSILDDFAIFKACSISLDPYFFITNVNLPLLFKMRGLPCLMDHCFSCYCKQLIFAKFDIPLLICNANASCLMKLNNSRMGPVS